MADLEQEVSRVATAHARLVRAAEGKLRDFGIPTEELGFLPQVTPSGGGGSSVGGGVGSGSGFGLAEGRGRGGEGGESITDGGGERRKQRGLHVSVNQSTVKA